MRLSLGLSLAGALLLAGVFPQWDLTLLAPFALIPMILAAAREPIWWKRLILGESAGVAYWFAICYWIQFVLERHGGMSTGLAWFTFALFALAKALHIAVFLTLAGFLVHKWYAAPALAALWTGLERTHGPLGFAWLALGNAGVDMAYPMRLAPVTGVYGLSFLFVLMSAVVALMLLRRGRRHLLWMAGVGVLAVLPPLPEAAAGREQAAAVQPNIAQDLRWTNQETVRAIGRSVVLSVQSVFERNQGKLALVVWPESPAPFYFDNDPHFRNEAQRLARIAGTHFLFGTVVYDAEGRPRNSAVLLDGRGETVARYDKMFLVPFGEFVPPAFWWVNRITKEAGDFVPGSRVVIPSLGGHTLGAFICYESAFPHLVRQFADGGAELLVNLTNDGYFGRTVARYQHLSLARMRAAENGRWLLRPTNDGVTVSIDPAGRIRYQLEPFRETSGRLRFDWRSGKTHYTRYGDWFAWSCLAAGLIASVHAVKQYRR